METLKIKKLPVNQQYAIITQVAYEANRALSEIIGGKPFNPPWEQFPEDLKQSMIEAVQTTLNDKIVSAEVSHLRWVKSRLELGYKLGEFINWKKKTHPNLVGFHDLPLEVQLKDILFLAVVNAIGGALGFREFDYDPLTDQDVNKLENELNDLRKTFKEAEAEVVMAGSPTILSKEKPLPETEPELSPPSIELDTSGFPILPGEGQIFFKVDEQCNYIFDRSLWKKIVKTELPEESPPILEPEPVLEPDPATNPELTDTILEVQDGFHDVQSDDINGENVLNNKPKTEDDTKPKQRSRGTGKGRAKKS